MTGEGGSPARRIGDGTTRPYSNYISPRVIKLSRHYVLQYWIPWRHIHHIVDLVTHDGVKSVGQYKRLASICKTVSYNKRVFLYNAFRPLFSDGSMYYLFGNWSPADNCYKVRA